MATNRINFVPGREPTSNFLNRVQDPPRFDGIEKVDYYNADELRSAWGINQRSGIADYEIDKNSAIAATAYFGLIKGAEVDPVTGYRLNEKVGAPRAYLTPLTSPGNLNIEIYGGSVVKANGEILRWEDLELTIPTSEVSYGFVDKEGIVNIDTELPLSTEIFTPLFRVETNTGSLESYDDLRPNSHLNYHPGNLFVLSNTSLITDDYFAKSWERVLTDTTVNTFRVHLPEDPKDGEVVGILDATGNFSVQNLLLDANGGVIENSNALYVLNKDYDHVSLVYSSSQNSWYFLERKGNSTSAIATNGFNQFRYVANDYTLVEEDYQRWIEVNSEGSTKVITLPGNLPFGFECTIQSSGGTTVLVSGEEIEAIALNLKNKETAKLIWIDNSSKGGKGVWKAFESLIPGTLTSGGGGNGGSSGENNTGTNVGTGFGLYKEKTGVELRFKSLKAGNGIVLTSGSNEVEISTDVIPGEEFVEIIGNTSGTQTSPTAIGYDQIAIGDNSTVGTSNSSFSQTVVGSNSNIYSDFGSILGSASTIGLNSDRSVIIGSGNSVGSFAQRAVIIGADSTSGKPEGIAVGSFSNVQGNKGIAIGSNTIVTSVQGISLGVNASNNGGGSGSEIAIGSNAGTSEGGSIAIGSSALSLFENSVSIGLASESNGSNSVSLGSNSQANQDSVSIGSFSLCTGIGSIQLGTGTNNLNNTLQFKTKTIANGTTVQATAVTILPATVVDGDGSLVVNKNDDSLYIQSNDSWVKVGSESPFVVDELTLTTDVTLTGSEGRYLVYNPGNALRNVILPQTPVKDQYYKIINDSDGLIVNNNILVIKETSSGVALVELGQTTGKMSLNFIYTGTKWVVFE